MTINQDTKLYNKLCGCYEKSCKADPEFINKLFRDLQKIGEQLSSDKKIIELANFGMALSSIERIIILSALKNQERCVCELEAILDKSQSTISHHLRKLERANLITSWKNGTYTYYKLVEGQLENYLLKLTEEFSNI
jgi:DNA-binding transcriptional ArsR family regulator